MKYFNPQPPDIQMDQPCLLENMRIALLEENSALSQLLVAPVSKDHSYYACEGSPLPLAQPQIAVACMSESTISESLIPSIFT